MKISIDNNILIDFEQKNHEAASIQRLIDGHEMGKFILQIPAISASETQPGKVYYQNFEEFSMRLAKLGLDKAVLLNPISYWDVTFFGHCVWSGPDLVNTEKAIHDILFPDIEFEYEKYCSEAGIDPLIKPRDRKWNNKKCDVLSLWCHIHYGGGYFVTRDENFIRKANSLKKLSKNQVEIIRPSDIGSIVQ